MGLAVASTSTFRRPSIAIDKETGGFGASISERRMSLMESTAASGLPRRR